MAPKSETAERSCIVTRETQPPAELIRFVRAPDGSVVPDLKGKLPGRGVWVTGRRDRVEEAVRKRLFSRGFKAESRAEPDLPDLVGRLLRERALQAFAMARKAGLVVTGFGKVTSAIAGGSVAAVVHAAEAAEDGRRKIGQALRRADAARDAGDGRGSGEKTGASPLGNGDENGDIAAFGPRVIAGLFAGAELDLALGGANVIHAALLAGGASASFLKSAAALARFEGGMPETDWTADLGHETATR